MILDEESMKKTILESQPAGYLFVLKSLGIEGFPNWHQSFVAHGNSSQRIMEDGRVIEVFRSQYWPGDGLCAQLEFALKYDGANPQLLFLIFQRMDSSLLVSYVQSKPTSKYARQLWFWYEYLLEEQLPLENVTSGNYVELLDSKQYYTLSSKGSKKSKKSKRSKRHRVTDNLLGVPSFCPIVRRTKKLQQSTPADIHARCTKIQEQYTPEHLKRALGFLYTKETKSSFEIEREQPSPSRQERFIALLQQASKDDFCSKRLLLGLQNQVVDARFADVDYRSSQNYVGESLGYGRERIHYVCPKPSDIHNLMDGLLACHRRMMSDASLSPLVHAAVVSYGFVFLHPFEDGNGRIHRFLLHNIFALRELVPSGLMFPISATMLKYPSLYDDSLERFSRPLMRLLDYTLTDMGEMEVEQKTKHFYQYLDLTDQVETVSDFVLKTIDEELVTELEFLHAYDQARREILSILDMPNRTVDLLIQVCLSNQGMLSARKRASHFDFLEDDEIQQIEMVIQEYFIQK